MITMNDFWEIVERINWKSISKNESIGYALYRNKNRNLYNNYNEIHYQIVILSSLLRERIYDYFKRKKYGMRFYEIKSGMNLSDDTLWYLCCHIVGLGKEEYLRCINNPKRIFRHKNFKEGFDYIF